MLSAFSVERCPPSRWNTVRHQHGIVSAIAWNTQPDVLDCLAAQQISPILMGQGFNIIDAVVSLYLEPLQPGKASRVLHIDLKQSGISNLRDMEEADARLVESLLRALGVMQSPASAKPVEEAVGVMHE